MSCITVAAAKAAQVCANCGKGGSDTIKLKECTACFLVKYCSVDCQQIHRKLHKEACEERAAELKDEKLYSQGHDRPESDFCPLCLLAIPFAENRNLKSKFYACCMERVCDGCGLAAQRRGLNMTCPFCRSPLAVGEFSGELLDKAHRRADAGDSKALYQLGGLYSFGQCGLEMDKQRAYKLWSEAAELGSLPALMKLGMAYYHGDGIAQDKAKAIRCWESAAMQGDAGSRQMLGHVEAVRGNYDRAVRHFLISAKMGDKESLDMIKKILGNGHATKAQYLDGLKGYQDAVEEMKSPQRDEAEKFGF